MNKIVVINYCKIQPKTLANRTKTDCNTSLWFAICNLLWSFSQAACTTTRYCPILTYVSVSASYVLNKQKKSNTVSAKLSGGFLWAKKQELIERWLSLAKAQPTNFECRERNWIGCSLRKLVVALLLKTMGPKASHSHSTSGPKASHR